MSRPFTAIDPVRLKFREANFHFEKLSKLDGMEEFYATVNAFVAAARSVLYVARHELGWKERLPAARVGFSPHQKVERKKFDAWYWSSPEVQAVLDHPLAQERDHVIHRDGQAGFVHIPKPIGGMAVTEGSPFRQAPFVKAGRGGRWGLPLLDKNYFYYVKPDGTNVDAIPYCKEYLDLIQTVFREIDKGAWRT